MTVLRRIAPTNGPRRSRRPDRMPTQGQQKAAAAVVVPLFADKQARLTGNSGEVENIFADLGPQLPRNERPADPRLLAARARARALLQGKTPSPIDNLFAEDCPDVEEAMMARAIDSLKARPRPLTAVRQDLGALHEEMARAGLRDALTRHLPPVAAAMAGLVAYAHFGALPAI